MKNFGFLFAAGAIITVSMIFFPLPALAQIEELDVSLGDLLNLEVTVATKTSVREEDAPSIVSVITGDEIRNMGARDIYDVLRTVPGFDITALAARAVEEVSVRGMSPSDYNVNVKLMIDGHSLSVLWGSIQEQFAAVPLANIKQIEIIRGPGSALYGTGAFLGVINIVTKKPEDTDSTIAFEGGSHDTAKPQWTASCQKGDFGISVYADYYKTNGFKRTVESDRWGGGPISAAPGDTTQEYEYSTIRANIDYRNFYFTGFYQELLDSDTIVGIANALTDEDRFAQTVYYLELGYKHSITENGNLLFKVYYDFGKQDAHLELFSEETAAAVFGWQNNESIFGWPIAENSITGSEITADYNVIDGIQVVGGLSCEYVRQFNVRHIATGNLVGRELEVDGVVYQPMQYLGGLRDISENGNFNQRASREIYAVYGQSIFDIKKLFSLSKGVSSLSLTAGLRWDHYEDFGSTVNPRFGLVYAPTEKLWFKTLYGTAFRAPNFKELYLINNPSRSGNPDLDPEEIATIELLAGYNFTRNLKGSITFFDVSADNLIESFQGIISNRGQMNSQGVEAEIKWHLDRSKYVYANISWQDVNDTSNETITSAGGRVYTQEDFNPGSAPEIYGNIGVNYELNRYVNANVWINHVGEQDRSEAKKWDGETLVNVDDRDPVKGRTLVNASVTFGNFYKGLQVRLSGYNLFDADHRDPDTTLLIEDDIPMEGVSFMGKVSYTF